MPQAELEAIVLKVFGSSPQRHMAKIFVPSADSESVLKDLGRRIAEAAAIGDFDAVAEFNAQASYDGKRITAGELISNDDDGAPSAVHLWTP